MRRTNKSTTILIFAAVIVFVSCGIANAQIQAAGGGYYRAGYPTVYGSFAQAGAAQSRMYSTMQTQTRKTNQRNALIKKWGRPAVEKAERAAASGPSRSSKAKIIVSAPPLIRNHGMFRPDTTVDTGKTLADALGDTPEEKALIKQIYTATEAAYAAEAETRGWKNNIAGGLAFFTVAAMTVYHDADEPSDEAVANYFKTVNSSLDEIPEFAEVSNKEKQGFNNMLIGFSGILLATYTEAKQTGNAETLATSKQLAAMMIEMVLKTDPENIRVENGQIVMN